MLPERFSEQRKKFWKHRDLSKNQDIFRRGGEDVKGESYSGHTPKKLPLK
jgi:hypothetical protein